MLEFTFDQLPQAVAGLYDELHAIRQILNKPVPEPKYDGLTIDQALNFLRENGYPIAKQTLYGMTYAKSVPYTKRGKRLIFSRKELTSWLIENRVPTAGERFEEVEKSVAENKRR